LTPEQYQRIEDLFSEACDLPPTQREAFLDEHCADDALVRFEVDAMLAADAIEERQRLSSNPIPRPGAETLVVADAALRAESIPERIGRYRILRECGHGGMGVVYEAEQESPSRRVALKVIRTGLVSPETLRRFQHETEVLGRLQHPGIAQIFEAGSSTGDKQGGQPFFAMEFVDGTELPAYATSRSFDTKTRLSLFTLVCDAVQHAHERGVIHRDLKPANILVVPPRAASDGKPAKSDSSTATGSPAGDLGQPKILDFGVARMTDSDVQLTTMLTHAGQLVGTLQYMSPEQASEGTLPIDARSDVYALGVVLYELLTGRPPYDLEHLTIPESVLVIRQNDATRIGSIDRSLAGDVETIVGKCLEKEPERRYSSAAELADDIRRHLRDEPITARPPSTWYQARKFARRNRALVGGVLATVVALLLGLIASMAFAYRAQENAALAEANATRALESEAAALRRAYVANLTAANALAATDPLVAKEQLDTAPEELRNWEWRYLSSQLRRYSRTYEESAVSPGPLARIHASVDVAFTPDGSELVAALEDGRIALWDVETTRLTRVGTELAGSTIRTLDVSERGPPRVACGTYDGRVRVWDVDADRWLAVADRDEPIWFVAWDHTGERLLFSTSTTVGLWREGQPVREHAVGDRIDLDYPGEEDWELRYQRPRNLTFTPDGKRFIATTRLGNFFTWWMWDADTGVRVFPGPSDPDDAQELAAQIVRATAVASHDRTRVALISGLRSAAVHDADTLTEERLFRGHRDGVRKPAWTTDDTRLFTSSYDATVRLWDATSGAPLEVVEADVASPLAVAPDGSGVVYRAGGKLRFWDSSPAATVLHPDVSYVYALTYSPDGSLLAASSKYSTHVTLFDPLTGRTVWKVDTGSPSGEFCFSRDGRRLYSPLTIDVATGAVDPTSTPPVAEWPLEERRGVREMNGRVVSADGTLQASSSSHGWNGGESAVVRNLATGEVVLELEGRYWGVALSPDNKRLAAALEYPGRIEIWDLGSGEKVTERLAHGAHAYCVEFHPDGTRLASGGNDNTVRLWDTTTWEQVLELRGHTSYVMTLDFSPDGTQLASGSGDLTVRLWDSVPRDERYRGAAPVGVGLSEPTGH